MRRHKAPGLSGLAVEMIQATAYWYLVDIGFMCWYWERRYYMDEADKGRLMTMIGVSG